MMRVVVFLALLSAAAVDATTTESPYAACGDGFDASALGSNLTMTCNLDATCTDALAALSVNVSTFEPLCAMYAACGDGFSLESLGDDMSALCDGASANACGTAVAPLMGVDLTSVCAQLAALAGVPTACGASFDLDAMDSSPETQIPLMCDADGSFNTCGDAVAAMMAATGAANQTAQMQASCGIVGTCGVSMLINDPEPLDFCDGDEVNACGEAVLAAGYVSDDELSDALCFIAQCNASQPNFMDFDGPPACFNNDTGTNYEDAASCGALATTYLADCDDCTTGAAMLYANITGCDAAAAQTYITTTLQSPYHADTVEGAGSVALPAASLLMIAVAGQYVF